MNRVVPLLAAGLVLACAGTARSDMLGNILGAFGHKEQPPASAFAAAKPEWEAYLSQGSVEAGEALFTRGEQGARNTTMLACQTCHGAGGVPQAGAPMPRLAGVTADYIAKQLDDYRAGRRKNEVMGGIAKQMAPSDIGSAALYLASLSPARFDKPPAPGNDAGRTLQALGDNARAIPACGNCHGPQGWGTDQLLPPLAGLSASYLTTQLHEWKAASRANDDEAVMRNVAHDLTEDEIASLSAYYASMR